MDDLETLLLGEPARLTRADVEAQSGVPAALAYDVWAAMGFAEVPHGEPAFTSRDVEALRTAASLLELGIIDGDTLLVMARAMGQGMAKLAEAQLDVMRSLSSGMTVEAALETVTGSAQEVLPKLDDLVLFVWRRQFAAAVQRSLVTTREGGMPVQAVGFLDLVNFTRSTRSWDAGQLERILERFERDTSLRVGAVGGRVVKTLGDGVLYTTDAPADAVRIALDTVAAHEAEDSLPSVRAGVAAGPLLVRMGDVFGEPVNIAARLSEEARPGTVLVDRHAAEGLGEGFDVRSLSRRSVRGYRSLAPFLVRAQTGQGPGEGTG